MKALARRPNTVGRIPCGLTVTAETGRGKRRDNACGESPIAVQPKAVSRERNLEREVVVTSEQMDLREPWGPSQWGLAAQSQ